MVEKYANANTPIINKKAISKRNFKSRLPVLAIQFLFAEGGLGSAVTKLLKDFGIGRP
jgi:hypothetical protein